MALSSSPLNHAYGCLRNLELLVEAPQNRDVSLFLANHASSLSEFLAICARTLNAEPGVREEQRPDGFNHARDVFVRAGLDALAARSSQLGNDWLQIGIRQGKKREPQGELYRQVAGLARRLIDESFVDDFFFMHKRPGMRLRFRTPAARGVASLADPVERELARWQEEGLIDYVEHGVYEPESQLFGGPKSMDYVHALFTVDSLIWLDYHACRGAEGDAISPAWLVSLAVLGEVFDGLEIVGWEDIGVWDRIRNLAGRRLDCDKAAMPMSAEIAAKIREVWSERDQVMDILNPAVREALARRGDALQIGAEGWRSGYFRQPGADLGPRTAAAFYVIFHWNRAALTLTEQAIFAEALADRITDDAGA